MLQSFRATVITRQISFPGSPGVLKVHVVTLIWDHLFLPIEAAVYFLVLEPLDTAKIVQKRLKLKYTSLDTPQTIILLKKKWGDSGSY